jgi:hypothetical protein
MMRPSPHGDVYNPTLQHSSAGADAPISAVSGLSNFDISVLKSIENYKAAPVLTIKRLEL